jgi:hypothetical protein
LFEKLLRHWTYIKEGKAEYNARDTSRERREGVFQKAARKVQETI